MNYYKILDIFFSMIQQNEKMLKPYTSWSSPQKTLKKYCLSLRPVRKDNLYVYMYELWDSSDRKEDLENTIELPMIYYYLYIRTLKFFTVMLYLCGRQLLILLNWKIECERIKKIHSHIQQSYLTTFASSNRLERECSGRV